MNKTGLINISWTALFLHAVLLELSNTHPSLIHTSRVVCHKIYDAHFCKFLTLNFYQWIFPNQFPAACLIVILFCTLILFKRCFIKYTQNINHSWYQYIPSQRLKWPGLMLFNWPEKCLVFRELIFFNMDFEHKKTMRTVRCLLHFIYC